MKMVIKRIDPQGRIILPLEWRKRYNVREVIIFEKEEKLIVLPRTSNLTKYIDSIEVDVENFEDYHELRKELKVKKYEIY